MTDPIRAIFFDIDGTLRDYHTGRIPDSAKQAVSQAKEAGILVFVATGRHILEIEEEDLLEDLEFDGYVTLNGQYCGSGGQTVYDCPVPEEDVRTVLKLLEQEPFPCMFMEADRMYINRVDDRVRKVQAGIGTRIPPVCDVKRAGENRIYQMVTYISGESEERIGPLLSGSKFIRWHDEGAYDLVPAGGSKCTGIEKMAAHFGISVSETAAVGDGENDVLMLTFAGIGIAMGNGRKEAKAAADFVTDSIENDGLSKAVSYILERNHQEE